MLGLSYIGTPTVSFLGTFIDIVYQNVSHYFSISSPATAINSF